MPPRLYAQIVNFLWKLFFAMWNLPSVLLTTVLHKLTFVPYRFWVRGETEQTKHNVCVAWKISSNWIGKFCSHLWFYQMFYYKLLYIMLYCFSIHYKERIVWAVWNVTLCNKWEKRSLSWKSLFLSLMSSARRPRVLVRPPNGSREQPPKMPFAL